MKVVGKRQALVPDWGGTPSLEEVDFELEHPDAGAVEFNGNALTLVNPGDLWIKDAIGPFPLGGTKWVQVGSEGDVARTPGTVLAGASNVSMFQVVAEAAAESGRLTAQQTFDKVVTHLRRQGGRAMGRTTSAGNALCAYRAPDGSRCAVGALLPVGHPGESFEGSVKVLLARFPDLADVILPSDLPPGFDSDPRFVDTSVTEERTGLALLARLQRAHDGEENWSGLLGFNSNGERILSKIARDFGLSKSPR